MTLICSDCSHENTSDAGFCQNCGQQLMRECATCGRSNTNDALFCKHCGAKLDGVSDPGSESRLRSLQETAPSALREKIKATRTETEGERKPVTIVFTDIVGSTAIAEKLDPEVWKEIVAGAHRRVGEAIYRYEGTIAQLLGDGVLAFFGAPITHEDDPVRAVRAAMEIQESVKAYAQELRSVVDGFHMRIGINTGTVVIGEIGTDMHVEYLAIGDAVNVAARLQSAAEPGKVVVSEACAKLVSASFDLKDLGEITVKGKAEPLQAFELISVKAEPETGRGIEGLPTPHVGRAQEVEKLQSSLLALCDGHGQIMTVMGDAGIGKTRLLEEVKATTCEAEGDTGATKISPSSIRWLEGRALSYGGSLSYWTITKLILADLGLSDGAPQVEIIVALRRRVKELFGEEKADETLPYLAHLLVLKGETEDEEHIQSLDGETLKKRTLQSVSDFFGQVSAEGPTVLVFEDMHWSDPSSLEALENILALTDRVPLMILMLMRIDRDHDSWGVKIKAETDFPHRTTEIHLHRLSTDDSSSLLEQLLGETILPEEIWRTIMERSEGNPFYLEEVIRHLMEQDLIVQDEQGWRATGALEEMSIPDTLQGVLLARIDRLQEDVRRTLQMASVIGQSFLYRILEKIAEAEMQLDTHLSQLQRVDLVREKARLPELEYIFKHALTQEAAYNSLLLERRKVFHLKVGEALEELFPDRVDEFAGLMAHHWERAGRPEKAVQYLLRAGERARRLHAHLEALGYYNRAVDLMHDDSDSYLPTLMHRAHVLLELFRGKEAVADFEKLQSNAHRNNDRQSELMTLLGLGRGNYILALDETDIEFAKKSRSFYESAYELAKEIGDPAGMIKALVPTTWYKDFWPEYADQARQNAEEALNLSLELGDEDLIFDSKLALAHTGTLFERERLGVELIDQLEARKDYSRLNILLFRLMFTNLSLGNFEQAIKSCEAGIEVARKIGVPPVQYATIRALAYIQLGRFDDARDSLEDEVADEAHRFGKAFRDTGYGIYYLEMLAYKKARETLESSIKQADLVGRAWLVNSGRFYLARALVEGGVGSDAEIDSTLKYFDPSASSDEALIFGHLALSNDDFTQALEMANTLKTYAEESGRRPDLASALLLKAQALMAMEEVEEAVAAAEEGVQLAMEMDYLPVLWRLRGTKAEALKRLGRQRETAHEFKGASAIIEELAGNISEEDLRTSFLSNPIVTSILAAATM